MYQNMTGFRMRREIKLKQSLLSLASFQNNKKTNICIPSSYLNILKLSHYRCNFYFSIKNLLIKC